MNAGLSINAGMTKDAYVILGIKERLKHSEASVKKVHDIYHELAREYHPDKNPDAPEEATRRFQEIQGAYASILKEFSNGIDDGPVGEDGAKLVKPWAAKKGRKFNHRAMGEIENLRKNAAKAAAQRELDRILGEEAGERPKEKRRAAQWDREMRMAADAQSRQVAEEQKVLQLQARREDDRRRKAELAEKAVSKKDETSLVHVKPVEDWRKAVVMTGSSSSRGRQAGPNLLVERRTLGSQSARTAAQIGAEEIAAADSIAAKLEAEEDLEFEIPDEFKDKTTPEPYDENEPLQFVMRRFGDLNFDDVFIERFPEYAEVGNELAKEQLIEIAREQRLEKERSKKKAKEFEDFWSERKVTESLNPVVTVPKKEKILPSEITQAAKEYTRTRLEDPDSFTTKEAPPLSMEQSPLDAPAWIEMLEDDHATDNIINLKSLSDNITWEQSMVVDYVTEKDVVDDRLKARKLRRADAVIKALEYESGRLLQS